MSEVRKLTSGRTVASRPKVVFVNRYFHPDESATSRILSDLAFGLADLGIGVAIVTSRQLYDDPGAALPAEEVVRGVSVHRVAGATNGRARLTGRALDYLSFHAAAGLKLASLLSAGDIVVAKTDPPLISVVVSHVAYWRGARLVNWLQDLFPEVAASLGMRALPGWLMSWLTATRDRSLRRAQANIVLGELMQDRLIRRGLEPRRIRIMPNWSDTQQIMPQPAHSSATRRGLDLDERFVIGYSGNLGRAHEFDTLLGAARLLREDRRFAFLIIGGGARAKGLRAAVEAERLDSFRFLPYQPPELLADSLTASDVHLISLLPQLEGLIVPSKLYGILAAGRPAVFIGDTNGEVARVLREGDCGVAVAVGDSTKLAEEFRALAQTPARLRVMSVNARRLAESRYTADLAVADWRKLLESLAPELRAMAYDHGSGCTGPC